MESVSLSQILVILGLLFEGASAYIVFRNIPWSYKDWLKKKTKTLRQEIKAKRNESLLFIGLLAAGLFFQAIALFI